MKKICFLTDSIFSIGGVQRVTAVIAKELAKDFDVTILSFDNPDSMDTSLYSLKDSQIKFRLLKYPQVGSIKALFCKIGSGIYLNTHISSLWASDLYAHTSFPSELRNVVLKELLLSKFDIIIGVHAPLAARLATLKEELPINTKLIGWLHNSFEALFGENSHYIGTKRKRHYIYQFKKLDEVIVLCQDDAKRFSDYDKNFTPSVIYNPITLQPGQPSTGTSKSFLTIGRFTPMHKGIDILIKAFRLFAERNKEWHLDIVGEGSEEQTYKDLIHNYQLEKRITLHPFTNQIQDFYYNAQIYVLSSRWEGMPLVLVEAMSHGLPIVTSNLPVCQEILGNFGIYFENGNIEELALRLEEATHINWEDKSDTAFNIAQKFNIENIIKQWKRIIDD